MNAHRGLKIIIGAIVFPFLGSACSHAPKLSEQSSTVKVFKSLESVQCKGGGITLGFVAQQLSAAGVQVLNSSCGADGQIYVAMCGISDGRIAIIEIPSKDMKTSINLGFSQLSEFRYAHPTSCQ